MSKSWKILTIGSAGVGKRAFLSQFAEGSFPDDDTIVPEVFDIEMEISEISRNVSLWNMHESELSRTASQDADACVIMFSTTDPESFEAISDWNEKVKSCCGAIPTVIVQNKIELMDETSPLDPLIVDAKVRALKMRLYRASAKENLNVKDPFTYLMEKCMAAEQQQQQQQLDGSASSTLGVPPGRQSRASSAVFIKGDSNDGRRPSSSRPRPTSSRPPSASSRRPSSSRSAGSPSRANGVTRNGAVEDSSTDVNFTEKPTTVKPNKQRTGGVRRSSVRRKLSGVFKQLSIV